MFRKSLRAPENVPPRRLADRHDRGMGEAAFGGDYVEVLDHRVDAADYPNLVLFTDMISDNGRRDKQSGAGLAERFRQRAVVELADDRRPQAVGV